MNKFDARMLEYSRLVQYLVNEDYRKYRSLTPPAVMLDYGRKYVRVYTQGHQTMVHTFVEKATGLVLKAASWKKPTLKNPRSCIWDKDCGASGITYHGAKYL